MLVYNQDLWPPGHFVLSGIRIFPAPPLIISSAFMGLIHPATAHEICEFGAFFSTNAVIRTCQCMWLGGDSLAHMKERNLGLSATSNETAVFATRSACCLSPWLCGGLCTQGRRLLGSQAGVTTTSTASTTERDGKVPLGKLSIPMRR